MALARTAMLRLYDSLADRITLDFTSDTPHILGCTGTLSNRLRLRPAASVESYGG
jgi:hypothetical protein